MPQGALGTITRAEDLVITQSVLIHICPLITP